MPSKVTCEHGRPWYAECLGCLGDEALIRWSSRPYRPVFDDLGPIFITNGPSCYGYLGEDGNMHETVKDAKGKVVLEKVTPFEEWNRI